MDFAEIYRNTLGASPLMPNGIRVKYLRLCGLDLGIGTAVASGATFKGSRVITGTGCFLNHGVYVDRGQLTLGDNVYVGPRVVFASRNHELGDSNQRAGVNVDEPITVGSGVWIGAGVIILGNVNIARGCVIAAGAVVTKDTQPNGVYAGVPATKIRALD